MPSSSTDTNQQLKFPPVRVNQSLTKLDLDSLIMRSTSRRSEEPGSSLDDSTYELLGDSLLDMSDDEAHTESIASTDGPTPDDASDFSDDDNEYPTELAAENADHLLDNVHSITSGQESTLTEKASHMDGSGSMWQITLDEQIVEDSSAVHGSKVIRSLPDQNSELHSVLGRYGCAQIRLVVRAALAQHSLPTPDTYKILFLGLPEKWHENDITERIGTALTASPRVSKSVMVRGQIEPYGPVIHRLRCVEFHTFAEDQDPSHILMILEDGEQIRFGPGIHNPLTSRPDLVVLCHPTTSGVATDAQEFASAGKVFSREGIPCIDLVLARCYGDGLSTYDSRNLSVCVEGRNDEETDFELKEVLPVDQFTFSQLDPSQLNRHLALISPHLLPVSGERPDQKAQDPWSRQPMNGWTEKFGSQWSLLQTLLKALLLLTLIPAILLGASYTPMLFQKSTNLEPQSSSALQYVETSLTLASSVPTSSATSIVSAPIHASPLIRSGETTASMHHGCTPWKSGTTNEKVRTFEIQKTGDYQFVLNPSKNFMVSRKKPQLQIQVSHASQTVPLRYNRTINGEYVVELQQEYPLGSFNVSITTYSKPLLQQSFEIVLGHNKTAFDQFVATVKSNLFHSPSGLWKESSYTAQQVRKHFAGWETSVHPFIHEIKVANGLATQQFRDTRKSIQHHLVDGSRILKQIPDATWMGLREMTAPVRTASPMLRARTNALRLRCKLETTAGFSTSDGQSWACSKVGADVQEHNRG